MDERGAERQNVRQRVVKSPARKFRRAASVARDDRRPADNLIKENRPVAVGGTVSGPSHLQRPT